MHDVETAHGKPGGYAGERSSVQRTPHSDNR